MWVVRMPPFEQPDEMAHADYMYAFFDAGRFYTTHSRISGDAILPQTQYVARVAGFRRLRYNPFARLTPGEAPVRLLETDADRGPVASNRTRPAGSAMPYVMFVYPATYYALVAGIARVATLADPRAIPAFFVARACNVAFGAGTLFFAYSLLRRRRLDVRTALLGTLGIAMLPLMCWVTAYVQPDNLVLFLVTFGIWAARREAGAIALTCVAVCALCLVKPHYGFVLWIPCLAYALRRGGSRGAPLRAIAALGVCPIAAIALALSLTPVSGGLADVGATAQAFGSDGLGRIARYAAPLASAVGSVYGGGRVFDAYWLGYGLRESYLSESVTAALGFAFAAISLTATFGWLALVSHRAFRIARIGRRSGPISAARLVAGGLEVNLCIAYGAFLILASVLEGSALGLQARYWLPLVVPTTSIVLVDLPRLFPGRRRPAASLAFACVVVAMTLPVNLATPNALERDFYAPATGAPEYNFGGLTLDAAGGADSFLTTEKRVALDERVTVRGFALDVASGLPADHVSIASDGVVVAEARNVLWKVETAEELHDHVVYRAGFVAVVPASRFGPGRHDLSVMTWRAGGAKLPLRHHVTLVVASSPSSRRRL